MQIIKPLTLEVFSSVEQYFTFQELQLGIDAGAWKFTFGLQGFPSEVVGLINLGYRDVVIVHRSRLRGRSLRGGISNCLALFCILSFSRLSILGFGSSSSFLGGGELFGRGGKPELLASERGFAPAVHIEWHLRFRGFSVSWTSSHSTTLLVPGSVPNTATSNLGRGFCLPTSKHDLVPDGAHCVAPAAGTSIAICDGRSTCTPAYPRLVLPKNPDLVAEFSSALIHASKEDMFVVPDSIIEAPAAGFGIGLPSIVPGSQVQLAL